MKTDEELIEMFNRDEMELLASSNNTVRRNGDTGYLEELKHEIYPVCEFVVKLSPNERIVFEEGLERFIAVLSGSK